MHCGTAAIAFVLTFGIILDVTVVSGAIVTWYDNANHRGDNRRFEINAHTCYNFGLWNDRISSIDTHNYCVIIWSNHGCQGHRMEVAPGRGCHSNFRDCEFNDIASSIELCGNREKRGEEDAEEDVVERWEDEDGEEEDEDGEEDDGVAKLSKALGLLKRKGAEENDALPFKK